MSTSSGHGASTSQYAVGVLPPGGGKRVRLVLVLFALLCLVPISLSGLAFLVGAARSAAQDSIAVAPLLLGTAGVLAAVALFIMLLWDRSQIAGDRIRSGSFRAVNVILMALGTATLVGGAVGVFVAVFGLRGALDALFAGVALAITGVVGLIAGAVMASVATQASVPGGSAHRA